MNELSEEIGQAWQYHPLGNKSAQQLPLIADLLTRHDLVSFFNPNFPTSSPVCRYCFECFLYLFRRPLGIPPEQSGSSFAILTHILYFCVAMIIRYISQGDRFPMSLFNLPRFRNNFRQER